MSVFERLAGWSTRHRWWAVAAWFLVLIGLTVGSQAAGVAYHNDFSLPGTQSQEALDLLREHAPARAGDTVQVVVAGSAVSAPDVRGVTASLERLPHVASIGEPVVSAGGKVAYATVTLDASAQDVPVADVRRIIATAHESPGGFQVELGGDAVRGAEDGGGGPAEGVGILAALVILVLLFGSLLAASLPIIIAVFAVAGSIGVIAMLSNVADVADFTAPLMILVGLGVGIDYALLVFSRYRAELIAAPAHADPPAGARPADPGEGEGVPVRAAVERRAARDQAAAKALNTAGRTVFFAGCTVMIALLGLVVLGLGSLQGVAVAVALTVGVTMLAALTLLPALLAIMGGPIERSVLRRARKAKRADGDRWRRWTDIVHGRPWTAALVGTALLLALAAPALSMRLGFADAGNDPAASTSRKAYDLLTKGFGPGFTAPLVVVATPQAAQRTRDAVQTTSGVASVTEAFPSEDGQIAMMLVFPQYAPQDERTDELVATLRARTGDAKITAVALDFSQAVAGRLPLFAAVVVGLSALLLMLVFRSVLIPLKAAVLNLLSVGAALGVITLVFQHGWFGVHPGPIEAYVPVMIFAIAFGLSMDYEVFLLARMHEEWVRTRRPTEAVREGLATTGRVVTAAAAIMVVVFGGFLLDPSRMLQQFGLGLAAAVLLDAVVIRSLILPAVMRLLGARAWWLPAPVARVLPRVALH
jgi:putative drug exporter of the RND superfamily